MNFEERVKTAIEMANSRLGNPAQYTAEEYAQTVKDMFALIRELEQIHETPLAKG